LYRYTSAQCGAAASAWWLVGYGCQLDKPGVAITFVGPDVPGHLHGTSKGVSGASHTPKVSFYMGEYHAFVEEQEAKEEKAATTARAKKAGTAKGKGAVTADDDSDSAPTPGPCLVFGADMVRWWHFSCYLQIARMVHVTTVCTTHIH
jgi:hypothetical protein